MSMIVPMMRVAHPIESFSTNHPRERISNQRTSLSRILI